MQVVDGASSGFDLAADHTIRAPSMQKQHLHNIMSYWSLKSISDILPSDFRHSTNERLEPSTLYFLLEIAKRRLGIDGHHRASKLIASRWDLRSLWSQDRPNGRDDSRQREVYLREDLEAILDHLAKVTKIESERARKAAVGFLGTERTVQTPTTTAPTTRSLENKRATEDADSGKNAKRHKSTSPGRGEHDTEQQNADMTGFQKARLCQLINDLWKMCAEEVVPKEMRLTLPVAKRTPATWSVEALKGLCEIMTRNRGRLEHKGANELRRMLGQAFHERINRPEETKEFIANDTKNVMRWMDGANFAFDAPGDGLLDVADLQVFRAAVSASDSDIANDTSTTSIAPQASATSGNAASNDIHKRGKDPDLGSASSTQREDALPQDAPPQDAPPPDAPPSGALPPDAPPSDAPPPDAPPPDAPQASNEEGGRDRGPELARAPSVPRGNAAPPSPGDPGREGRPATQSADADDELRHAKRRVSIANHDLKQCECKLKLKRAELNELELQSRGLGQETSIASVNVRIAEAELACAKAEAAFGEARFDLVSMMRTARRIG